MLHNIQVCRVIAALLVVFFHSAGNLAKEKYFGHAANSLDRVFWFGGQAGVAFFFVLSGFIVHYVHEQDFDKPERLLIYLKKRLLRIYPTYWIIFIAVFVLAKTTPSLRDAMPTSATILFKSLLLLPQDSEVVGGTGAPVIIVAWSLQYEIVFYAVFALALVQRSLFYIVSSLVLVFVVSQTYWGPFGFPGKFFASHLVALFGMGVACSVALKKWPALRNSGILAFAAALGFISVAAVATVYRDRDIGSYIDISYGAAAALLIFGLASYEFSNGASRGAIRIGFMADSSYALYLLHFPLVSILSKIAILILPVTKLGAAVAFFLLVCISVAASLVFNLAIERPLLRKLNAATRTASA